MRVTAVSNQIIALAKKRMSSTDAMVLPNIPCISVKIVASPSNVGNVWIGGVGNFPATAEFGTPLAAGDTLTLTPKNSNLVSYIGDNDTDEIYVTIEASGEDEPSIVNELPVVLDVTAPTAVTEFPTDSSTDIEINTEIYLDMSEAIDPESVDSSTFTISPSKTNNVQVDSESSLRIRMTLTEDLDNSTVYTITAVGGGSDPRIKDLAGNALASNFAWSFTTAAGAPPADSTPPTIVSKNPTPSQTDVAISISPQIVFSEQMLSATINTSNIFVKKVSGGTTVSTGVSLGGDNKTVTVTLDGIENSTVYEVSVTTGVTDLAGNPLAALETWQFTTVAPTYNIIWNVTDTGNTVRIDGIVPGSLKYGVIVKNASSSLFGDKIHRAKMKMRRTSSSTNGTIVGQILNASNVVQATLTADTAVSAITSSSSSSTEVTFTNPAHSITMGVDYKFVCYFDNTSATGGMRYLQEDPGTHDSSNTKTCRIDDTDTTDEDNADFAGILYEAS